MDRAILRISPENFVTVAILSGAAYLGIVGMTMLVAYIKNKTGMAA
jgi:hypothetical protein